MKLRGSDADLTFTVGLFVVALVPRLLVALALSREPVWDGHYYHFGAERLAVGLGYSEDVVRNGVLHWKPWTHYPVGYSAFLSVFYRIFGHSILLAPILSALTGAALAVTAHRLARYFLSPGRARLAGALVALHPGLIAYAGLVMTEPLAGLLLLLVAYFAMRFSDRKVALILCGVTIGLGALVRPVSLGLLLPLALTFTGSIWRRLGQTAIASLICLLTIFPWTLRNCRVMDGCALISTNGGWNLAIGALTETGRFRTLRADDGCPIVTGQVQQDRCWAEVGLRTIVSDPVRFISLIPKKLSQTYDHESFPVEYLHEAAPELWPEARRAAARDLLTLWHRLAVSLAALSPIALVISMRRRVSSRTQATLLLLLAGMISYSFASDDHPFFGLVLLTPVLSALPFPGRPELGPTGRFLQAALLLTTLTHAVFFGEDRYHIVVSPVLCILAAAALTAGPGLLSRPSLQRSPTGFSSS